MSILLAIPVLSIATILQSAVISRMPLLHGTADIILLTIIAWAVQEDVETGWQWGLIGGFLADFTSGLPFGVYTISYLLTTGLAIALRKRIWKLIVLGQLFATVVGTLLTHAASLLAVFIQGTNLPLREVLETITLPSIFLNLLFTIPVYILIQEIALRLHPEEIAI